MEIVNSVIMESHKSSRRGIVADIRWLVTIKYVGRIRINYTERVVVLKPLELEGNYDGSDFNSRCGKNRMTVRWLNIFTRYDTLKIYFFCF